MKNKIIAALAVLFALTLTACTENNTVQPEQTETATSAVSEETAAVTETETEAETTAAETVIIAGQEFSVDEENVVIYITNDFELTTYISEIGKLKNLRSVSITNITDGGPYAVDGFKVLEGCKTLERVDLAIGLANEEDVRVLETLPNLKSLSLYGRYDNFEFNIPSLEYLYLLGTYDLSKLESLTSLKDLSLEYNSSEDLSPIKNLPNLTGLMITECGFTDYSSILELNDLEGLWISSRPMTKEMYNKICEKFPDCKITIVNDFIKEAETVTIAGQEYSTDTSGLELVSVTLDGADLKNIAKFKKLESLHLTDVKLDNIDFLRSLPQLKWLYAENTPLPDISPIAALDCPDQINLVNCGITDISGFESFRGKKCPDYVGEHCFYRVCLSGNAIKDFSPLAGVDIRQLDLCDTKGSDYSTLNGLTVHALLLEGNDLTDIGFLTNNNIGVLFVEKNNISDFSPLFELWNEPCGDDRYYWAYVFENAVEITDEQFDEYKEKGIVLAMDKIPYPYD